MKVRPNFAVTNDNAPAVAVSVFGPAVGASVQLPTAASPLAFVVADPAVTLPPELGENVTAGSDCGYGTWVGQAAVDPDVVWAKLAALAEGARLASRQFRS